MAMIVGVVSQKGGVGKSTLARLMAREFAVQDWQVKIADLDVSQATSFHWRSRRLQRGLEPDISVEQYGRVEQSLKIAEQYDLLILDGAPHATQATLHIAQASHLVILPTGFARVHNISQPWLLVIALRIRGAHQHFHIYRRESLSCCRIAPGFVDVHPLQIRTDRNNVTR